MAVRCSKSAIKSAIESAIKSVVRVQCEQPKRPLKVRAATQERSRESDEQQAAKDCPVGIAELPTASCAVRIVTGLFSARECKHSGDYD